MPQAVEVQKKPAPLSPLVRVVFLLIKFDGQERDGHKLAVGKFSAIDEMDQKHYNAYVP